MYYVIIVNGSFVYFINF